MEKILKSQYTLWAFFVLSSVLGYMNTKIDKGFIKKVSPTTLVVGDAIVGAIALTLVLLLKTGGSMGPILDEMQGFGTWNFVKLFFLAATGTALGIFGASLIEHHDITHLENVEFFAAVLVSALAMIALAERKTTSSRIMGFILIAIGGYMIA